MTAAGRFITFEGIEGTGKSTQILRLKERLARSAVPVVLTREPGGTELGAELRSLLLRPSSRALTPTAELLLYVTDRAQHLEELVGPALDRGDLVLCDRYLDATLAYQGYGRGLNVEKILDLHRRPPLDVRPDRTVLIDLEPAVALGRARARNRVDGSEGKEDRFERELLEFHERVRAGYLALAAESPERFRIVDGAGSPDAVERQIVDALADLVPQVSVDRC